MGGVWLSLGKKSTSFLVLLKLLWLLTFSDFPVTLFLPSPYHAGDMREVRAALPPTFFSGAHIELGCSDGERCAGPQHSPSEWTICSDPCQANLAGNHTDNILEITSLLFVIVFLCNDLSEQTTKRHTQTGCGHQNSLQEKSSHICRHFNVLLIQVIMLS